MRRLKVSNQDRSRHEAASLQWDRTSARVVTTVFAILIAVFAVFQSRPSTAESAADYFKGRTVTIIVGSSTGGGYDLNARVVAEHFRKNIANNPSVVVKNLPGAGGLKAAGYMFNVAPKDGSELAILQRNLTIEPLFSKQPYDGTRFSWIGSVSKEVSLCISSNKSKIKAFADLRRQPFIAAGQSAGSDSQVFTALLKNLFGVNVKLVSGYPGTSDMMLAIERGEADGMCGISYSTLKSRFAQSIADGSINLLVQASIDREPDLPNVPTMAELATNEQDRAVIKLLVGTQLMGRPFLTAPGIPADRLVLLRQAFDRTMADPEFISDAQKRELDVSPLNGAGIDALLRELYASPRDVTEKAAKAMMP
jgi:tripartite-type tricarboxylate transporter receptor subunit TctC